MRKRFKILLLSLGFGLPQRVLAQSGGVASAPQAIRPATDQDALQKAEEIELRVIEETGPSTAVEAFKRRPVSRSKGSSGRSPSAREKVLQDYYDHDGIFVTSFGQMWASALNPERASPAALGYALSKAATDSGNAVLFRILMRLSGFTDVLGPAGAEMRDKATALVIEKQREAEKVAALKITAAKGSSLSKAVEPLLEQVLPPEDFKLFGTGDPTVRATLLFKAVDLVLTKEPFPNGLMIALCDTAGGEGGYDILKLARPTDELLGEDRWYRLSKVDRWQNVTNVYARLFHEGATQLPDATQRARFRQELFDSFPVPANVSREELVAENLGSDGLQLYDRATSAGKEEIFTAAAEFGTAASTLVGLLITSPPGLYRQTTSHGP